MGPFGYNVLLFSCAHAVHTLYMCCIISDGPPAVVMMFTYKEVIDKMEKNLTDPKYHEVLVLDDDQARQKREQKRLEKEKDKEKEQKGKSSTFRPKKKPRLAESKELF